MRIGLTKRMAELRDFIASYEALHGCSPSYDEMMSGIGARSRSTVHRLAHSLVQRGAATLAPYQARSITVHKVALEVAYEQIAYAVQHQHVGPRQVLESIFGRAPAWTTLASTIEQVAVAWERMQDGSQ